MKISELQQRLRPMKEKWAGIEDESLLIAEGEHDVVITRAFVAQRRDEMVLVFNIRIIGGPSNGLNGTKFLVIAEPSLRQLKRELTLLGVRVNEIVELPRKARELEGLTARIKARCNKGIMQYSFIRLLVDEGCAEERLLLKWTETHGRNKTAFLSIEEIAELIREGGPQPNLTRLNAAVMRQFGTSVKKDGRKAAWCFPLTPRKIKE